MFYFLSLRYLSFEIVPFGFAHLKIIRVIKLQYDYAGLYETAPLAISLMRISFAPPIPYTKPAKNNMFFMKHSSSEDIILKNFD